MITLPPEPATGEAVLPWARAVNAALRRLRLTSGPGIRLTESANSTAISADPGKGGTSSPPTRPFQISIETGNDDTPKIRVRSSTLAGGSATDIGFSPGDDPPYQLTPSAGKLVGGITYNTTTKAITSRWLEILSSVPAPEDGTAYVEIGTIGSNDGEWIASNSRYGPIQVAICRNWFAATAPRYTVHFS